MTNFGKRMTVREWMDIDRPILRECDEEVHEMLDRVLTLVEAAQVAESIIRLRNDAGDKITNGDIFAAQKLSAALAAMKEAGDIEPDEPEVDWSQVSDEAAMESPGDDE